MAHNKTIRMKEPIVITPMRVQSTDELEVIDGEGDPVHSSKNTKAHSLTNQ